MLLRRCFELRPCFIKKYLFKNVIAENIQSRIQEYRVTSCCHHLTSKLQRNDVETYQITPNVHRKWYSKGLIEGDATKLLQDIELKKISEIFPEARVTLNILSSRTPDKIFDVTYKQHTAGKKAVRNHEWTCIYKFVWPEKVKFECTALTKRQAAEKAALQALHYLYTNKRIDSQGRPIYDKNVLEDIKSNFNEQIKAEVTVNSMKRIDKIWNDYESGIKDIYEKTAERANLYEITTPAQLTQDSTIDEDEYAEDETLDEIINKSDQGIIHPVYGRILKPPSEQTLRKRRDYLKRLFEEYDENIAELPIDHYADVITSTVHSHRVSLIVGAAGCGKSTRVPAAILRHSSDASILVSEPRRVAAIGLAERVASEMGEEVGESIGYQVRLHCKPPRPPAGAVLYCTSGVLLNRLHNNPGLLGCTHVIIDEAHERDVNTDVTLLLLKRAMETNPQLKVVIMSATLDTEVFTKYFDSCPIIEVPGRTYPVQISYLEEIQTKYNIQLPNTLANCSKEDCKPQLNVNEITEVVKAIDKHEKEGAILVFLPGWAEISYAKQLLDEFYKDSSLHMILPVHARLSAIDQSKMFSRPAPGVRKIVLSTNVAETSVTIPDVIYVVDSGASKLNTVAEGTGTISLETVWASQAAVKQRAGRAGRVQSGHCFRLYTKEKEDAFSLHSTPEILRVPLEQTVLDSKTYAPDEKAVDFLSKLPEPPTVKSIQYAVDSLIDIGVLTPDERVTRLGGIIRRMRLPARGALLLVRAAAAACAGAGGRLAAGEGEMFVDAAGRRGEIREIKKQFNPTSDHAALNWIQNEYESQYNQQARESWCQKYGLRRDRLDYVKSLSNLYLGQLISAGCIEPTLELEQASRFSDVDELIVAVLLASYDALLVTRNQVKTKGKLKTVNQVFTTKGDRAHIASESVNFSLPKLTRAPTLLVHCGGQHSVERRALILYRTSVISPQAAVMFTMGDVEKGDSDGETTELLIQRHNLKILVPDDQVATLLKARHMLWNTFDYYVNRDIRDLDYEEHTKVSNFRIRLMKAICRILVEATGGAKYNQNVLG